MPDDIEADRLTTELPRPVVLISLKAITLRSSGQKIILFYAFIS